MVYRGPMDTHTTVDQARRQLAEAQRNLDAAIEEQQKLDSFPTESSAFLVIARQPSYDQFVSYSELGIPQAVFATEAEAERYRTTIAPPVGYDFLVEELPLHG